MMDASDDTATVDPDDMGSADLGMDTSPDAGLDVGPDIQPQLCEEDQFVESGACVDCPIGKVNRAGGDPTGPDTSCFEDDACYAEFGVDCDAFKEAYLKPDEVNDGDRFGTAVPLDASGNMLAVGADGAEVGDVTDPNSEQGVVYIFEYDGTSWSQEAALEASDASPQQYLGGVIDLDGDTLVVGSFQEVVYVFERSGGTWAETQKLEALNGEDGDGFGSAVAIDGDTLVIGAPFEDGANGAYGDATDNGLENSGAVYVFERSNGSWAQEAYLKASTRDERDRFGTRVSLDGDTIAVGVQAEDSNATGVGGDEANNDAQSSGAVIVFARNAGQWSQQAYLKASNAEEFDVFGSNLALVGDTLAVTANSENSLATGVDGDQSDNTQCGNFRCHIGAVYVFTRSGSTWSQQAYIKATNTRADSSNFGRGLALGAGGDVLVVGAQTEDGGATGFDGDQSDTSSNNAGAVYLYERDATGTWSPRAYVKAFHDGEDQRFGMSVALDAAGRVLATAAPFESGSATGINGDMTLQDGEFVGAVYINRLAPR